MYIIIALVILILILKYVIKKEYFTDESTPPSEGQRYSVSDAQSVVEAFRVKLNADTGIAHSVINVMTIVRQGAKMKFECMTSNCKTLVVEKYGAECKLPLTSKGKSTVISYGKSTIEDTRVGSTSINDSIAYANVNNL